MRVFIRLALSLLILFCASTSMAKGFTKNKNTIAFINSMADKHNFDPQELHKIFSKYSQSDDVIRLISKPYEALDWKRYRKIFVNKSKIDHGLKFWNKHESVLTKLEQQYKVPAEIIVAIIGAETFYGTNKGKYPVIQSLSTLAFNYPRRANFFKKQLEEFLLMTREQNLDPLSIKGSYAGAMGIPQFIPSSYRSFAVSFGNKKSADIMNDVDSAMASVANYLKANGWKDEPDKVNQAKVSGKKFEQFITRKLVKPKHKLGDLTENGIKPSKRLQNSSKLSLIKLDIGNNNSEYWLTDHNFYVITTYNRSYNYAMAIYQLSKEIKKLKLNETKK